MCSTTWHNFFRAKSKKIFDFFFASHTQTDLKNTQHGPKNLIFCYNMPNYCVDFLGPFPIFQLTWKNSNSKKSTKSHKIMDLDPLVTMFKSNLKKNKNF